MTEFTCDQPVRFGLKSLLGLWIIVALADSRLDGQSVCLPSPRLLTTLPMGAQQGSTVDVTITGQNAEEVSALIFSHPAISAKPKKDAGGAVVANQFVVSVKPECPVGIYEARIQTRLGVSTARAFSVGDLSELTRTSANTTLATAMEIPLHSLTNAYTTRQSIDYYRFQANKGQRVFVECAAAGIDSKLKPVVIIGDEQGADLMVERRGGALDFIVPASGLYTIKVHDLTYQGGKEFFYRLAVRQAMQDELVLLQPSTRNVSAFSWPPNHFKQDQTLPEKEPNNSAAAAQKIELPCSISGSFFPAADVDTFEFNARKGETWWFELASERLGRPTDPTIVIQSVSGTGAEETVQDVAELSDILSPVKVSSNGYSYDGPPYNAGSSDVLGSFTAKSDGRYRILVSDLFGGTRRDPRNVYRLIIRKAQPDFAVVGWALHMNLRNGDRNALSKPLALRRGAAIPIEVVVVRRDGFNGEINLTMDNLPPGVYASGIKIPAGQQRGYTVIGADHKAPAGFSMANFYATAEINGQPVRRQCHWASMRWPVPNAWSEIPNPRIVQNIAVSVTENEYAPLSIAANEEKTWEVAEGGKLTIPLVHTRRGEFQGATLSLKTLGHSFSRHPVFEASLSAETSSVTLDLAKIKAKPGDYTIAFYGSAVAKYSYHPQRVNELQSKLASAKAELLKSENGVRKLVGLAKSASPEQKTELAAQLKNKNTQIANFKKQIGALASQLKRAQAASKPKDIVDIVVSKPIRIRVKPATEVAKK